jgi:hypothetical protein
MRPAQIQTCQSSGGFSMPQKSPAGLSNSSPANHDAPSTTEIASAVLAILLRPCESNSTDTDVLFFSCTGRITPHPCALTTTVSCFPENLCSGSRLVITTGIRRVSLVLRLAFLNLSSAVPSLELTLHPASAVPASHTAVHTKDRGRDNVFSPRAFYEIRTSELHHDIGNSFGKFGPGNQLAKPLVLLLVAGNFSEHDDIVGVEGAKHRRAGIFGRGLDTSAEHRAKEQQEEPKEGEDVGFHCKPPTRS